ncbi:hypothetical protein C1645_789404 [Glomus cerebriforme]|uniref:F-box domain-containing protein n=1 Tax=Glomus cerebriforme TaxID=658196 RepID=A0A397SC35_9GLOM|nr:hypothetical protein C1645_789404 [Glomus cerebriforme]
MAYSKLSLGDLPEITNEILQRLDDYSTLYSCILVNRLWCRLAMPFLWRDPFSISKYKKHLKYHFIDIYLYFLGEADKNILKKVFEIDRIDFISPPLFNYPHFIKALNTNKLELIVSDWIDSCTKSPHQNKGNSLYYNLPQVMPPSQPHCSSLSSTSTYFEFSPLPKDIKNINEIIRHNFQHKVLPVPNILQKRRGAYYVPYSLPVDFKSLKREAEIPTMKMTALPPPRGRQPMFPINSLNSLSMTRQFSRFVDIEKSIKLKRFICCALIKLFITHSASLITFEIILRHKIENSFIYDVYEMIKNNSKFISDIENFTFHNSLPITKMVYIQPLISYLPSLCNLIKNLKIQMIPNRSLETSRNLSKLICSQRQLSKLTFREVFQDSLSSLKNVAHTLTCLIFDTCHFINIQSFQGLECLENLESLQFIHCYLKSEIIEHLSNIKNLKIKTLSIINRDGSANNFQYQLLLLKIGSHLENLILSIDKNDTLQNISHFCEKIKFIHFTKLKQDSIPELNRLILNFGTTLRYLTLDIDDYSYVISPFQYIKRVSGIQDMEKSSILLLQQLGQLLPPTLEYIDLFLILDPINLKTFLINCKHLKLSRLLLRNKIEFYLDFTLQLLKEFIIEMNSIQYLAYRIGKGVDSLEWDLGGNKLKEKEKAREFDPYVKVKNYNEVVIRKSEPFYV